MNTSEHIAAAFSTLWEDRYDFNAQDSDLFKTPERVARMLEEFTYQEEFKFTVFDTPRDEMVVVQDIPFVSLCAHHVLPFIGVAHVGYVPNGKMAGLSKIARTVQYEARGLNVQEHLTENIARFLEYALDPKGVAVVMKAEHTCMTLRGIKAIGSVTSTSYMGGVFSNHDKLARQEFFELIGV